jgi:carbamate kinase
MALVATSAARREGSGTVAYGVDDVNPRRVKEKLIFVAIGGNSLIKGKRLATVEHQHRAIRQTVRHLADLIVQGYQLVISHGNGPQAGFIMLRSEVAHRVTGLHLVPLPNVVADTQGSIGYQIQQSLNNELVIRGVEGHCVTVVTQVVVDSDDPGFGRPSKPVGGFYDDKHLESIRCDYPDWTLVNESGRGFRRVVPSPEPREVVEKPVVETLLRNGYHVVTIGGGGIPVVKTNHGLEGVDAVIDKDLASSLLANQLNIGTFIISTAVEQVALNFGKPNQRPIHSMTVREAEQYVTEGHFAPGSMLPKIEAALRFLKGGGRRVVITAPEFLEEAVLNGRGTHIVP